MTNVQLWKILYLVIMLGTLVVQPKVAFADNFGSSCRDTFDAVTLRVVSVEIDGEDEPTHPAIGREEFSLRATESGDISARLADPITGEAQSFQLQRLGQ